VFILRQGNCNSYKTNLYIKFALAFNWLNYYLRAVRYVLAHWARSTLTRISY